MNLPGFKIALVANTDWYLANFRLDLARALRDAGADVHLVAPQGSYLKRLSEKGFNTHALAMGEDGYSLIGNRKTLKHLTSLYTEIQPDIVHHFTPRCVVLGSMAARKAAISFVINALTGLGHIYSSRSIKSRLARPLMRLLLRHNLNGPNKSIILQNQEDMDELVGAGIADRELCHLIRGSGVDPVRFQRSEELRDDNEIRVFFASRLIAEKGIHELVQAMEVVAKVIPRAVLWIAGEPYAQNPTSLDEDDLEQFARLPYVRLLGHRDDMVNLLKQVDIVALPSYREGTPKILLEAASCSLPIVATDIAGCRGVVEHTRSGYLVPPRNVDVLVDALNKLCGDAKLRRSMGERGRKLILQGFTSEHVIRKTLNVYHSLLFGKVA